MFTEQLLNIITWDTKPPRAIEVDKVHRPTLMVRIAEQRRVRSHRHDVRVAFHACHESGFTDGAAQIALAGVAGDRVFAHENLRAFAVVTVIAMRLLHEKFRCAVIMFIHDIRLGMLGNIALPIVGDELHVRIFRFDRIVEKRPTIIVGLRAVLVTDLQILHVERCRMTVLRAQSAPETVRRAVRIFQSVKRVLHPLSHLIHRDDFLVRHADVDAEQRLGTQVFGHL